MEEEVKTPEIDQETQPIAFTQETRAERLRNAASAPDFSIPEVRPAEDFFSESVMQLDEQQLKDMMRETGVTASVGEQTAVAIGNSLRGMNQLGDELKISYGNLMNYFTGNSIGDDISKIAYEAIAQNHAEIANREDAIGGITNFWAQLAGGATSFTQLALEGIVTAGALPLAHIGIQEFGQGTYNDMKAYADEHDGSLKGYEPKGFDIAANTANALLQVGIEAWLGVGSPRFLVGASRGLWVEGLSGALQEGVQGALSDLTEAVKGNQDISILLDNAEDYLRDAIVGGILQGSLGAVTHHQNYARSVDFTSKALAKARGHEQPTAEDRQQAKAIIDAKERQESSVLTKEFKAAFDASTGEGQLQAKIASALKKAAETKELDLDTANETEMAQRIEQIATQETLNAMDYAREQNRAISDIELNDIVYKDGAIWLEGLTPEVGDKAVSYARVLAERQSGLAEVNMKLDTINQEIATLKKDLAEAKQQNQEARAKVLQARIDKQNALAEKNRVRAEKLKAQTAKLEKQIAKQEEKAKIPEPVKTEKVSAEVKPVEAPKVEELAKIAPTPVLRTSLKKERAIKKTQTGITRKLDADSKFVKVIDKPSNVDFSDGKEYADSSKRYLLNKVIIKEQDGNLYFKLTGGRYTPTSYVVIENYVNTDPYEIFSAQVEEGKEIGDHFDRAVQDFYKEKSLWSLAEPVKLRSWEEYMKDSGQVTAQPSVQVSEQVDESSLEQYDPRKQYNKYDMVRVRTQSGEHIGVWDGSRMTLHETIEEAQDFIKNDTEREEADRQADERRATAQKEESKKQEKAFREGQGFVEMPYIIQLLKDNDMWEGLSLREKGNFNAIGSVMFSNGRIVNAFGNENSKKGTKVTQNTLDTIQKLRDKLNQSKPTGDMESWAGKTNIEIADEQIKKAIEPILNELKALATEDNVIINNGENQEKIKDIVAKADWNNIVNALLMKYDFDPDVIKWLRDSNVSRRLADNPDDYNTNLDALIDSIQTLDEYVGGFMDVPLFDFLDITEWEGKRKDINDLIDKYEKDLYILPKSISEAETKILNYIGNEYMEATEYDTGNIDILPDNWFSIKPEQGYLLQGSMTGKGDTARGGYDEQLKRIILGEKSDLSTIQHEFAHYWIQNNFKWARSGLASQDWLRRWRDVEEWLGIEPQDRLLSKSASEKFAKAYERYILEGKVAPELQWAFEGFQKAYQDIYDDLENEYFDLDEELAPEVVDWFNRNKEQSPKRLLQADEKKLEKALTLAAGGSVIEEAPENTIVMTEQNKEGDPVVYMGVKESEIPAGDNLLVQADKTTASKLQRSAKNILSDKVEVQQLATLDTQATLQNFKDWIARDRAGAWNAMMNPDTRPIYRTYLYKAFAEEALNDVDLAIELANVNMAESVRELGQAIQALDIRNISGFDTIEIIRNIEKSKGTISSEELNKEVESIGLNMVELSQDEIDEVDFNTECKL